MSLIEQAVALAKKWAADASHGYDQSNRWGPDYDCSSFIIAVLEAVGIKVRTAGATYTGNMRAVFTRCGFEVISLWTMQSLLPGDILLNEANHTAMYIGDGKLVQARSNENGGTTGGKTGDQNGREIAVGAYYNYPWDCVLRYTEKPTAAPVKSTATAEKSTAKAVNSTGAALGDTYTVKAGDTLWSICGGDYSLVQQVAKLNSIDPNRLRIGQVLKMPGKSGTSAASNRKTELEEEVLKLGGRVIWK